MIVYKHYTQVSLKQDQEYLYNCLKTLLISVFNLRTSVPEYIYTYEQMYREI